MQDEPFATQWSLEYFTQIIPYTVSFYGWKIKKNMIIFLATGRQVIITYNELKDFTNSIHKTTFARKRCIHYNLLF